MISAEKMLEMMNPTQAFEAMRQAKIFDVADQSQRIERAADQVVELMDLYQKQTRQAVEFWMEQREAAVEEGKKFLKEWAASLTQANSELVREVQATAKDAAKELELPKPAKSSAKASASKTA